MEKSEYQSSPASQYLNRAVGRLTDRSLLECCHKTRLRRTSKPGFDMTLTVMARHIVSLSVE
jgi:hypothetical protein